MERTRVLLVDDEPGLTRGLKFFLEENGPYEVREENAAARALTTARRFRPHVIVLDVVMPDVDGGDIAGALRDDPLLGRTPVIFLTATLSREEATAQGTLIHGSTFLAKPVRPEVLMECIEGALAR